MQDGGVYLAHIDLTSIHTNLTSSDTNLIVYRVVFT